LLSLLLLLLLSLVVVVPNSYPSKPLLFHQLASREQLPVVLGWALTIHKCVGMTLERVHVECSGLWEDGQFYTAVSRCRTLDGVYLNNFDPSVINANQKVVRWWVLFGFLFVNCTLQKPF
jgi:ATP-dependent exoDNAse (exonuclease V) alpha subunit